MPLADQELWEFEDVLARMDEAELDLMLPKASAGEFAMREHYKKEDWSVYPFESRRELARGPDAIAWKRSKDPKRKLDMRILDNKSGRKDRHDCPSGLSGRSLKNNLGNVITEMDAKFNALKATQKTRPLKPDEQKLFDTLEPARDLLKETLKAARQRGTPMPPGVELWVTNACGLPFASRLAFPLLYPPEHGRKIPVIRLEDIRGLEHVAKHCS